MLLTFSKGQNEENWYIKKLCWLNCLSIKPSMKIYHIRKCVYNLLLPFLVTTLHKLGPKTLYHSYSKLTIDVEKDFYTEENSMKCKKKGRELLISVINYTNIMLSFQTS